MLLKLDTDKKHGPVQAEKVPSAGGETPSTYSTLYSIWLPRTRQADECCMQNCTFQLVHAQS